MSRASFPDFLKSREKLLDDVQETIIVPDMHTRKRLMFESSDAFVALPGGIGTLEELVEQMTWAQLGRHTKPILLLSPNGFWKPLLTLFAHMREQGFIRPGLELNYLVAERVEDVLPMLEAFARRVGLRANAEFIEQRFYGNKTGEPDRRKLGSPAGGAAKNPLREERAWHFGFLQPRRSYSLLQRARAHNPNRSPPPRFEITNARPVAATQVV